MGVGGRKKEIIYELNTKIPKIEEIPNKARNVVSCNALFWWVISAGQDFEV